MIILHFDCVNSTQVVAKQLLLNGYREFVITADTQTEGRGRMNERSWISCNGNFHASFVLNIVNTATIVDNVLDIIHSFIFEKADIIATKKYPNDILINEKKIAGVIAEVIDEYVVIGIGLNILEAPIEKSTYLAEYSCICTNDDIIHYVLTNIR